MFEILQYSFFQRALIAGSLIAIVAPVIGVFLVVRRLSALSDTLAHTSLIGVALAFLFSLNPVNIAMLVAIIASIGIEKLREINKSYSEAVLALFLSGSLGLSSVIVSFSGGFSNSLFSYLFGSINTVSWNDVRSISILTVVVVLFVIIFFRKLFLTSLDEELAVSHGIRVKTYNIIIVLFAAITVALGIQVVGVLLIGSLIVIPVITALQYKTGFKSTILMSVIFSVVSVWVGLFLSYFLDISSGGMIVLVNILFFLIGLGLNRISIAKV